MDSNPINLPRDHSSSPCIGIDLGTTNSVVAIWQNGGVHVIANDLGHNTTPSIVYYDPKTNRKTVGNMAKIRLNRFPKSTLYGVKRMIGQKFQHSWREEFNYEIEPDLDDNPLIVLDESTKIRPEEVSAQILIKMKGIAESYLQQPVKKAVITVPAYFNDGQRSATKAAARIAGLDVVRMINEPTAACLCYGLNQLETSSYVLVYDLGGGTLDVSLLSLNQGLFEVLATNGDCHLGGEDFDLELMNYYIATHHLDLNPSQKNKLKSACEDLKRQLSQTDCAFFVLEDFLSDGESPDLTLELMIADWNNICTRLARKCLQPVDAVLADADLTEDDVDQIVLVGGSTRIRMIQNLLKDKFKGKPLNKSINPDEAIACGAAIQAAILNRQDDSGKTDNMVLVDVTPLSLGIETTGGIMSVIVPRNTSIPCEKTSYYTTVENNQREVEIRVYQGERTMVSDCRLLGTFYLKAIPAMVRGIPKIKVCFKIDSDGILNINAIEETSNLKQQVVISNDSTRLSEDEIERLIREADRSRDADQSMRRFVEEQKRLLSTVEDFLRMLDDQTDKVKPEMIQELKDRLNWTRTEIKNLTKQESLDLIEIIVKKELTPEMNRLYVNTEKIDDTKDTLNIDELNQYLSIL